jgi:carbonic anhydrase/acetyltransferase-like protein (isoleucine patch superfamily)
MPGCNYTFHGYRNRLRSAADLRQLTTDGLMLRNRIRPVGREIRPGIWVGNGARIQKGARLVAPCYIGAYSRVRPAAVITRGSAIEHHAEIDCGTVVEGANVLPFSYVGAGLDVCQSIVGFNKLAPLRRPVEVEITDPKLVSMVSQHAPVRAASSVGALFAFLPAQLVRGLLAKKHREQPVDLQTAIKAPSAALREPAAHVIASQDSAEFPANMMVARRYGNE